MSEPQHTFEEMLSILTSKSRYLTDEANGELQLAYRYVIDESYRQLNAFVDANRQTPEAKLCDVFNQVSLFSQPMPRQPGEYGYHMMWGALFGMLIGQLNDNLTTSGRPAARRAAIDYLRREAAKRGINFA